MDLVSSIIVVAFLTALVLIVYDAQRTGRNATFWLVMVIFLPPLALVGYPWARLWDHVDGRRRRPVAGA